MFDVLRVCEYVTSLSPTIHVPTHLPYGRRIWERTQNPGRSGWLRMVPRIRSSVDPLGQIVAALQLRGDLRWCHRLELGQVLGVLPLEELDAILGDGLAPEVAIGRRLLVLWLTESQRLSDGTRTAVESDLDDVGDIVSAQASLFCAISLDEKRQRLCHANGVRELNQGSLAQATLHDGFCHLPADVGSRPVNFGGILAREGAAAVSSPSTIGVDDDLAACQPSVSLRTTDDELARWVDVKMCVISIQTQRGLSILQGDLC